MEPKIKVSHQKIAKQLGLSRATVSRALNDHPSVLPETKTKILNLAKALGYQKDAVVSHLMSHLRKIHCQKSVSTIAYLTTFPEELKNNTHGSYKEFYLGAQERAETHGYRLDIIEKNNPQLNGRRATQILQARGIKGIIIAPRPTPFSRMLLDWSQFSVAAIGHPLPFLKVNFVSLWHYDAMFKALRALKKYGYKNIGYAVLPDSDRYAMHSFSSRFALFREESSSKKEIPMLLIKKTRADRDYSEAFSKWYAKEKPEVVISGGTRVPLYLKKMGLKIPKDVLYVDICIPFRETPYAGVFEKPRVVGATAIDLVVEQIHMNKLGLPENSRAVLIEGDWVDGPSLPFPRKKA